MVPLTWKKWINFIEKNNQQTYIWYKNQYKIQKTHPDTLSPEAFHFILPSIFFWSPWIFPGPQKPWNYVAWDVLGRREWSGSPGNVVLLMQRSWKKQDDFVSLLEIIWVVVWKI